MLQIISEDDRVILDSDIKWYSRDKLLKERDNYTFYITTDFAVSNKITADYSVISVWALDKDSNWHWVDGILRRQLMSDNIEDLFKLADRYKPVQVGIEISGQQAGFIPWILSEMNKRKIFFPLAKSGNKLGIMPTTKKEVRFSTVEPLFKLGKMHFPEEMRSEHIMEEAVEELSLITPTGFRSKHDDFIDSISMLSSLPVMLPSSHTPEKKEVNNNNNYIWGDSLLLPLEESPSFLDDYLE